MINLTRLKKTTATSVMAILMAGTLNVAPSISIDEADGDTYSTATGKVSPDSFSETIEQEQTISLEREITVNVDDIVETIVTIKPEKLDVLFLADNTGSMGSAISNVQENAVDLLKELAAEYDDIQVGVARYYGDPKEYGGPGDTVSVSVPTGKTTTYTYKGTYTGKWERRRDGGKYYIYDFVYEGGGKKYTWTSYFSERSHKYYGGSYYSEWESPEYKTVKKSTAEAAYELQEAVGASIDDAVAAIDNWSASGGGDWPEANFFALHQAATSGESINGYGTNYQTNWRSDAKKIIVWFGDAKSHTDTLSQKDVIKALEENDISVIAINAGTSNHSLTNGINADSQASGIAEATDGEFASVYSSEVAETMASLIGEVAIEETTTTEGIVDLVFASEGDTDGLNITYTCTDDKGCEGVKNGESRKFTMEVTGDSYGIYEFKTIAVNIEGAVANNSIIVNDPNNSPTVKDDSIDVYAKINPVIMIPVLNNDVDPDGDQLTILSLGTSGKGSIVVEDNQVKYTVNEYAVGSDSFNYTVSDGNGGIATATVNVNIIDQFTD